MRRSNRAGVSTRGRLTSTPTSIRTGVDLPPIAVFMDDLACYVADGFHRTHAASRAGLEALPAEVHEGTKRDAILYGIAANSTHGLPTDRRGQAAVVTRLLQDDEWGQWSNNAIAKHCGVAHSFVAKVRSSLESDSSETKPRTYTTRHGTIATMETAKIGGRSKPPAPAETDAGEAPAAPAEDQAVTPEVLTDGSSLLVHAPTPLANGSTPRRREAAQTVQAPTPADPGSSPPEDQHIPYFDLDDVGGGIDKRPA